ncbi:MAG TPA: disulfide bond formation protein DsbA, partial [Marinobacter adhaerens]|nr:disulfide bond formation protein DsbA [Marinobacter adhaerens]
MGEAKRRKETGAPPPQKGKSNKLLYAGIGLLALAAVLLGVFFLTAPPKPTSDGLPVAAPNAEDFPAQLDQFG